MFVCRVNGLLKTGSDPLEGTVHCLENLMPGEGLPPFSTGSAKIRRGVAQIDILVCLLLAVLIVTIASPGCVKQRHSARRMECLSNMRQVAMAIQAFAASTDGHLPGLTSEIEVLREPESTAPMTISWAMAVLPALDNTALFKGIKKNAVIEADGSLVIADTEKVALRTFTCPVSTSFGKAGALSFVVNAGFIPRNLFAGDPQQKHRLGTLSWDESAEPDSEHNIKVTAATGVIWRPHPSFQSSLDAVIWGDGTSNTLLLTENLQAGLWYDLDTASLSFALPIDAQEAQVPLGSGTFFESTQRPLNTQFERGTLTTAKPQDWKINSDLKAAIGTRPRPSSNHGDIVNVVMCDCSGRAISQAIDPHLYVRLLTQNGVAFGENEITNSNY